MESFMLVEYFMTKDQLIDLAKRILKAQDIRELSWDKGSIKYIKDNFTSSKEACEDIEDENYRNLLIEVITGWITFMWNDCQYWAKAVLEKYDNEGKNDSSE